MTLDERTLAILEYSKHAPRLRLQILVVEPLFRVITLISHSFLFVFYVPTFGHGRVFLWPSAATNTTVKNIIMISISWFKKSEIEKKS